tara:strand:+ start:148 stop:408 length:261 start_codon:yes stop_codon:yes gene_type:complete
MKLSKLFKIALLGLATLGLSPLPSIAECRTTWDGRTECSSNFGDTQYKIEYKTNWDGSITSTDSFNGQNYKTRTCRTTWDGGSSCY